VVHAIGKRIVRFYHTAFSGVKVFCELDIKISINAQFRQVPKTCLELINPGNQLSVIDMKIRLIQLTVITLLVACNQKNELNYIAFKVSKDAMIDSLKVATGLLDKMDYGNGATCFVVDGNLHHTRKEFGFSIVEMPEENSSSVPIIEPLDQENSIRLFNLIYFLNKNGINGLGKRSDGLYSFGYKQDDYNPYNDFNQSRDIVYIKEPKDTCSKSFRDLVILDRYKNILLRAPTTYNEPKLPMDSASIMKRRDDLIKKGIEGKK
jgi:hypothetical protein